MPADNIVYCSLFGTLSTYPSQLLYFLSFLIFVIKKKIQYISVKVKVK